MLETVAKAAGPSGASRSTREPNSERLRTAALGQTHGIADSENAAIALAAGDRQRAAEFGEDARGDAEAETCAAAARFRRSCLFERTEDPGLLFLGHARAGISNRNRHGLVLDEGSNQHAACGRELDGVADDVEQNLANAGRIEVEKLRHGGGYGGGDLDPFAMGAGSEHFHDTFDQLAQIRCTVVKTEPAGLHRGMIQQIFDQLSQGVAGLADTAQVILLLRRQLRLTQEVGHPKNAVQWRS
jgi:hypothetical protein